MKARKAQGKGKGKGETHSLSNCKWGKILLNKTKIRCRQGENFKSSVSSIYLRKIYGKLLVVSYLNSFGG